MMTFNTLVGHCASCGGPIYEGKSAVFDERTEENFCDRQCFEDWASDHFSEIVEYYASLNVYDVCY